MATLYVKEQGANLRKEQERLVVTRGEERLLEVPVIKVDRVIVMGRGVQVSTAALVFLAQRGIPVVYTNQSGTVYKASVNAGPSNNGALRLAQARMIDDAGRALPLVQAIVLGKLTNQMGLLWTRQALWPHVGPRALGTIERVRQEVAHGRNADQVRGYEGAGAAAYWSAWTAAFQATWGFAARTYYPPPDPLNALLSFGYTVLLNEVLTAAQTAGLDPFLGFFHVVEFGRPSLALDIEEEFRPLIVDELVVRLVEARTIGRRDFMQPPDRPGAVYLNEAGRTRFLEGYETRLQERMRYAPMNTQETWRRAIVLQVQQMARTIIGEQPRYQPLIGTGTQL